MIFRYYFPGLQPEDITPERLEACGLHRTFWDCLNRLVISPVSAGPDDGPGGVIVTAPQESDSTTARIGFYPNDDRDTWVAVEGEAADAAESGGGDTTSPSAQPPGSSADPSTPETESAAVAFWIGYETDNKPIPRTLRRPRVLDGYDRVLGDGQEWTCPKVRQQINRSLLPQSFSQMSPTHSLQATPEPEYAAVSDVAAYLNEQQIMADCWEPAVRWDAGELDHATAFAFGVALMSASYRVGFAECSLLKLFTQDTLRELFRCAVDDPWRLEVMATDGQKKTQLLALRSALVALFAGQDLQTQTTNPP